MGISESEKYVVIDSENLNFLGLLGPKIDFLGPPWAGPKINISPKVRSWGTINNGNIRV